MNGNRDSLLAAKKALLTKDYLAALEGSELFSASLVGFEFEVVDLFNHKTQKTANGDPIRLIKCQRPGKTNQWYLTSVMRNCEVTSVEDGVDFVTGSLLHATAVTDNLIVRFKVEGFEPSEDQFGYPIYSMQVYSESKVRKFLKGAFDDYIAKGWSEAKGEARNRVRAASGLFMDSLCDEHGKLTAEAEAKFRLGTLRIRVMEVI